MLRGQTTTLEVTYNPENTDDDRDVTWTSSDPSVASVDAETGVIKALRQQKQQNRSQILLKLL